MGAFDGIDLSKKLDKETYNADGPGLMQRLGDLQRQANAAGVPAVITVDGWEASGKGVQLNRLLMALDPHGYEVYAPPEHCLVDDRPFFYQFWVETPAKGRISIFSNSWYGQTLDKSLDHKDKWLDRRIEEANAFEKALADDGVVIIKLFLHIGKDEQKARLDHLAKDPIQSLLVNRVDKEQNKKYGRYLDVIKDLVDRTDTSWAPWVIVEAENKRFATIKIIKTVIDALERRLSSSYKVDMPPVKDSSFLPILERVDLSKTVPDADYKQRLDGLQERLKRLQILAYKNLVPVVIVFEGWDAAGKSGGIKRICEPMDPRGYDVDPTSAPIDAEKAHHYLWRFWREIPARGKIVIFDRSWYGRVLVERVESLITPPVWERAYGEINDMERELAEFGTVVIKLWLQIDLEEQLKRYENRELNPFKTYKLTSEDWRNRDKWDKYLAAADEMLSRTDTPYAPWTIVPSNDKRYSRIKVLETVVDALEAKVGKE